jgi:hypothetical protein
MFCYGLLVMFWCEAAQQQIPVDSFCQLYEPVRWAAADTRKTKEQADAMNAKWKAICATK